MHPKYDIIIVGCGLVGSSLGLALPHDLSIAIIEPQSGNPKQPGYLAINQGSYKIWQALGVWPDLLAAKAAWPINTIEVSEAQHDGSHALLSGDDVALNELGYVVDSSATAQVLFKKIQAKSSITLYCPAQATIITHHDDEVQVTLADATQLIARLVIIADGGHSHLRESLGFELTSKQYSQQIMLAMVETDKAHHGQAFERFTAFGPVALLPIKQQHYNLVWTMADHEVDNYLELSDELLLHRLQHFYGERAGKFVSIGTRKVFPLTQAYVKYPAANRVILMGNAAHLFHPVGAQGFNLSLKDVISLVELIKVALIHRHDMGSAQLLAQYTASRVDDTKFVLSFTSSLLMMFAHQSLPLVQLRQWGLSLIDKLPLAKQAILKRALGITPPAMNLKLQSAIPQSSQQYDIIIIGNRLIGATLACALSRNYKIAIIDKAPPVIRPTAAYQLRINAYNRAAEQLLREIGVWQLLPAERIFAFDKVAVVNEYGGGGVEFSARDCGECHIGYFIENDLVNYYLHQQLKLHCNVAMFDSSEVLAIRHTPRQVLITTDNAGSFSAKLLAACDGANSPIRELSGIDVSYHAYYQKCIVGNVEFTGDLNATAWQRFLTTGPVGLLPLAKGVCSLAWSCDNDLAVKLMALDETAFIQALQQAIQGRLGTITRIKSRASFPLVARHATRYIAPRTVLLGDAAHVIHPLGGLGANIGFQDVIALCQLLNDPRNQQRDLGRRYLLQSYQKSRRLHNSLTLATMTAFNNVFSNDLPGLKQLRDWGLSLANHMTPAKKLILQHAMWMNNSVQEITQIVNA